jgi:hypothetical protein
MAEELWFNYWQEQEILLLSITFRPALGPTKAPVQSVSGAVSPGVKHQGHEADHSPPFNANDKKSGAVVAVVVVVVVAAAVGGGDTVDWTYVAQERDQWWAPMNIIMNLSDGTKQLPV